MVQILCKFCQLSINALEWESHKALKSHLQELPLKILVKGSFNEEQLRQLEAYFSKFGTIRTQVTCDGVEFRFYDARVYSDIIHQEHRFLNSDLQVFWYKKTRTGSSELVVQDEMFNERYVYRKLDIINTIKKMQTFPEQLKIFQTKLENIKNKHNEYRGIIHDDLKDAIAPFYPKIQISFFGSNITELEIHNSKFDVYLSHIDTSFKTLEQISQLLELSDKFSNILLNSDQDISVVNALHKSTKIICDISIKKDLLIAKSELIKFYLTLDEKLRVFMLLIKFWADCYGLKQDEGFSSYAIYLLVIFYLQQEPYKLPSVATLQQTCLPDKINGWNCAFGPVEFINSKLQKASILELLSGFFKFYGSLNYVNFVISPFLGELIYKASFLDPCELPDCFKDYKNQQIPFNVHLALCVQDFFEHSDNITKSVSSNLVARFSALCRNSFDALQLDDKNVLYNLFMFVRNSETLDFYIKCDKRFDRVYLKDLLLNVLEDVCYLKVNHFTTDQCEIFTCKGEFNVWDNRIEIFKEFKPDGSSVLEKETKITSLLVEHVGEKFYWELEVCAMFEERCTVTIDGKKDCVSHIGHFIYVTLIESLNEKFGTLNDNVIETIYLDDDDIVIKSEPPDIVEPRFEENELICISDSEDEVSEENEIILESESGNLEEGEILDENLDEEQVIKFKQKNTSLLAKDQKSNRVCSENLSAAVKNSSSEVPSTSTTDTNKVATLLDFESLKQEIAETCRNIAKFEDQIIYFINRLTEYEEETKLHVQKIYNLIERIIGSDNLSGYIFDWGCLKFLASNIIRSDSALFMLERDLRVAGLLDVFCYYQKEDIFIEFMYKELNLKCKLCLSNKKSIQNIQLLEYYLELDIKIRILFNFVQFWLICYDIYPHIDSDAIYILIIFYLQQPPYSLPGVNQLQENVQEELEFGWNRAFNQFNYDPKTLESFTMFDLIYGFFKYYENFDYLNYVITPFSGFAIDKVNFVRPFNLPFYYYDYVNQHITLDTNMYVCIQDPFEHCKSLRFDVEAESFSYFCRNCSELMNNGEAQLLSHLFLHANDCNYTDLYSFFLKRDHTEELQWKCFVRALISTFFEKTLACDVEVLTIKTDEHRYVIKGETKVIEKRNEMYKVMKNTFATDMNEMDRENAITTRIMRHFPVTQEYWNLIISVEFLSKPSGVKISNIGNFTCQLEAQLFHFMRVKLGRFLNDNTELLLIKEEKDDDHVLRSTNVQDGSSIYDKLQKGTTLSQQMTILYESITTPEHEVKKIYSLIERDLKLVFSLDQQIFLFGSKSLHLDFKNNPYDIFIEINKTSCNLNDIQKRLTQTGKFMDFKLHPISLRCKHIQTQAVCFLNIDNKCFVKATNLIRYYMSYDSKIPQLLMLVKFYFNQFIPANDGFTSYPIYLLVIFYLQQKPYFFPPVSKLKEADYQNTETIRFNNCLLNWSVFDLVTGFFSFYGNFDYSKFAICPYVGAMIEKEKFLEPYDLPDEYKNYTNPNQEISINSKFYVQDIFNHTKNITRIIDLDTCGKLTSLCRNALLEITKNYDLSRVTTINCDFLKFEINKSFGGTSEVWKKCVEICTNDVLKQILSCQLKKDSIASYPIRPDITTTIYEYQRPIRIWENRIKVSKELKSKLKGIEKEASITSAILKQNKYGTFEEIQVTLVFEPEKVEFTLRGKHDMIHITHIIYLNLIKLLKLSSPTDTETILEGKIWNLSVEDNKVNDDFKYQTRAKLPSSVSFEQQVTSLIQLIKVDDRSLSVNISKIRKDLIQILSQVNEIRFFGSSVSGLFTQKSSLDIYINLKQSQEVSYLKELFAASSKFTDVEVGDQFASSYLRCEHQASKFICDIYFELNLTLYKSQIVKYYTRTNSKIRNLMLVIRFWAYCVGLKDEHFSNYVFSLLVIFYLQQKPYNLPTVSELQEAVMSHKINKCVSIMPIEVTSPALKQATVMKLLEGFFDFYGSLDYFTFVISPYSGQLIEKPTFFKTKSEYFNGENFNYNIWFCIQDPIELSRNLVSKLDHKLSGLFTTKCRYSSTLIKTGEKHLLTDLLTPELKMDVFEIYANKNMCFLKWKSKVLQTFKFIVTEIFKTSVIFEEKENCFSFMVGDFIERYKIEDVCRIQEKCCNDTQWRKDARLMSYLKENSLKHSIRVRISFHTCPIRATLCFSNTTSDYLYHYIHIFYVQFLNLMSLKEYQSRDNTYSIASGKTYEEQATILNRNLSCYRAKEEKKVKTILKDLSSVLSQNFVGMEVNVYNRSITGLGNRCLSIYISNVALQRATIELMTSLISKCGKFENVVMSSDIEISIKSKHISTQTFCEINVKNQHPFTTSQLINCFKTLDKNVELLMVIVKYWADFSNCLFPNDALLLMVIFFLQDQYKFPSVVDLQKNKPWQVKDLNEVYKKTKFFDLLLHFFNYYSLFDSTMYLISPYVGTVIKKVDFLKPYNLPKCFEEYTEQNEELTLRSVFDIQDPFQHAKNLLEEIDSFYLEAFAFRCYLSAQDLLKNIPFLSWLRGASSSVNNFAYAIQPNESLSREEWIDRVKFVIAKILRDGFGYQVIERGQSSLFTFECSGNPYLYNNSTYAAKLVLLANDASDLDKTTATTKLTKVHFNKSTETVHMIVNLTVKESDCVLEIQHSRKKVTPLITHLLFVKIMKCLNQFETRESTNISGDIVLSEQIENQTTTVLTDLQVIATFSQQVLSLQKTFMSLESQLVQKKEIEQDIRTILSMHKIRKIIFSSRVSVTGNLHIYIEFDRHENIQIEQVLELISKKVFSHCIKISKFVVSSRHIRTNVVCAINISYQFSEESEKLMQYYCSIDKVLSLIFIIQFWADRNKLTDVYGFTPKAISLMVIFFLQQEPYNLVSVSKLQENLPTEIQSGWNTALALEKETQNNLKNYTLFDLVLRFFEFYAQFDYISNVISPFCESVIPKVNFLKPYDLPACYENYIKQDKTLSMDASICIQDCFDHSLNIAADVPLYFSGRFAALCRSVCQTYVSMESAYLYKILNLNNDHLTSFVLKKSETIIFADLIGFFENSLRKMIACGLQILSQSSDCRRYIFSGRYNIWNNRIKAMKKSNITFENEIEREIALSKFVVNNYPQRLLTKVCIAIRETEDSYKVDFESCDFNLCYHLSYFIFMKMFKRFKVAITSFTSFESQDFVLEQPEISAPASDIHRNVSPSNLDENNDNDFMISSEQHDEVDKKPSEEELRELLYNEQDMPKQCLEDQCLTFYTYFLKRKEKRENNINILQADLLSCFGPKKFYVYGSSVTGLDLFESDVNISVDLNSNQSKSNKIDTIKEKLSSIEKFDNISDTSGAKIICRHIQTKLQVTIDDACEMGIQQTEFVKYYLNLDGKLQLFIVLLKTWAKRNELFKKYNFTGYGLTLMGIFYLQQEFKLPSVSELQKDTFCYKVNDWNCAFAKIDLLNSAFKNTPIDGLLTGFFKFYGSFDYFSFVIAPFFGFPIAKTRFLKPFTLPEVYSSYMKKGLELPVYDGLCIQDLFEHTNNIASAVSCQDIGVFAAFCRYCCNYISSFKGSLIDRLLDENLNLNETLCGFKIYYSTQLPEEQWIKCIKQLIPKILKDVFVGNLEQVREDSNCVEYRCEGVTNIWKNRIHVLKRVPANLKHTANSIHREVAITSAMNQNDLEKINWCMSVEMILNSRPLHISVSLKTNFENYHLCHFLYTRLMQFLNSGSSKDADMEDKILKRKSNQVDSMHEAKKLKHTDSQIEMLEVTDSIGSSQRTLESVFDLMEENEMNLESSEMSAPDLSKVKRSKNQPILQKKKFRVKILNDISKNSKFENEISCLFTTLLKTKGELLELTKILHADLKKVLSGKFTYDDIIFFGSIAHGLFSDGSCVDIYIDNLTPIEETADNKIPFCQTLEESRIFPVICKQLKGGHTVMCKHNSTLFACKIYTKNKFFVYTSNLINFYLTLDSKLPRLLCLIKTWAQCNEMLELSSYSLILMMIFYLQQAPFNLPSVSQLQKNCKPVFKDSWNVAFSKIKIDDYYLQNASLKDLYIGFFEFYSNFDYFSYVISPYAGYAIPKTCFLPPIEVPNVFYMYKKNKVYLKFPSSSICVQDFFNHCRNVASNLSVTSTGRFACLCRNTINLIKQSENEFLYRVLSQVDRSFLTDFNSFELIKEDFLDDKRWIQAVINIFDYTLKNICCSEIKQVEDKKLNTGKNVIVIGNKSRTGDITQLVYTCNAEQSMWKDRINIEKKLQLKKEVVRDLSNDITVSKYIMENLNGNSVTTLMLELTILNNPTSVRIKVTDNNKIHLVHFLYLTIKCALEKAIESEEVGNKINMESYSLSTSAISSPYKILVKGSFTSEKLSKIVNYFQGIAKIIAFKQFGDADEIMAIEFCFWDAKKYLKIIQQKHIVDGEKLNIVPLALLRKHIPNAQFDDWKMNLISSTTRKDSLTDQIEIFLSQLEQAADNRKKIEQDCNTIFSKVFYKNKIAFSGFNFENDNLDFYILNLPTTTTEESIFTVLKNMFTKSGLFQSVDLLQKENFAMRFKHVATQKSCFLRVKRKEDTNTYHLLKSYISCDKKLYNLMALIKFWADFHGLIDINFLSNTSLYLMIIFYLQQKPHKLATVKHLQRKSKHDTPGWNFSMGDSIELSKSLVAAKLEDLFLGFFKFYANFDYISYVISPYFGSALLKTRFLQPYTLPEGFEEYKRREDVLDVNCGLCIQDFYVHNRNYASTVALNSIGIFASLCRSAVELNRSGKRLLLYKIFLHCHSSIYELPSFIIEKNQKMSIEEWAQNIKTCTFKILLDVLNSKLAKIPDVGANHVTYNCTSQYDVWNNRIKAWKAVTIESDEIDKEIAISIRVVRDYPKNISWNLSLQLTSFKFPPRVKISFEQETEYSNVFHICHFLYTRLKRLFENRSCCYGNEFEIEAALESKRSQDDDFCELIPTQTTVIDLTGDDDQVTYETVEDVQNSNELEFEDNDDIPSDFFDDFANEDFLDGFDIADAGDDDSRESRSSSDKNLSEKSTKRPSKQRSRPKSPSVCESTQEESFISKSQKRKRVRSKSQRRKQKRNSSVEQKNPAKEFSPLPSSSNLQSQTNPDFDNRSDTSNAKDKKRRKSCLEEINEKLNEMHSGSSAFVANESATISESPLATSFPNTLPTQSSYNFSNVYNTKILPKFSQKSVLNNPGRTLIPVPLRQECDTIAYIPSIVSSTSRDITIYNEVEATPMSSNMSNDSLIKILTQDTVPSAEEINVTSNQGVVTKCEAIINYMNQSTTKENFKIKSSPSSPFKSELRYASPLRKGIVKIGFTNPSKKTQNKNFTIALNQILRKNGILKNVENNVSSVDNIVGTIDFVDTDSANEGVKEIFTTSEGNVIKNDVSIQCNLPAPCKSVAIQVDVEELEKQ